MLCSACSLISLRNVSSGGILALAEYWNNFGPVLFFTWFSSFMMKSFDFSCLSLARRCPCFCVFGFYFGRLFSFFMRCGYSLWRGSYLDDGGLGSSESSISWNVL